MSDDSAYGAFAITPSDTVPIAGGTRAILANGAGNVVCKLPGSTLDVTVTVAAGGIIPFRVSHVRATGTTATGLLALT